MTTPSPDHLKTLEQSRQRLIQLTHSLGSLITSLNQSDPLPSWSSLQTQASIISNNLQSISTHLSENHELLRSISALPSPEFPTKTHANTLEQLLRTKLDPRVEDWVGRGRKADNAAIQGSSGSTGMFSTLPSASAAGMDAGVTGAGAAGRLSEDDLAALWEWAPVEANSEARRRNWGGNFTLEEKERGIQEVVAELGLKRVLEEDEESEEEEEEEEMDLGFEGRTDGALDNAGAAVGEQALPLVPMNEILRYMTTGVMPAVR